MFATYTILMLVFLQGGLHQISWFQFLPHESELNCYSDKRFGVWIVMLAFVFAISEGFAK